MRAHVERLCRDDEPAIESLLLQEPTLNLFLLGFLGVHPVDRARWYGSWRAGVLRAVVLILPHRLAVPYSETATDAAALGAFLAGHHPPSMLVGPRVASDALWAEWARGAQPERCYEQRLYLLTTPPPQDEPPGFRRGRLTDSAHVAAQAAAMSIEDLGIDPMTAPRLHHRVVQDRLRAGRTWIIARGGEVVFQVNVGTISRRGVQIGGTYVPPARRGQGLATSGVAAVCRWLLARYPLITLHVNEANAPAVSVYERCGFRRADPMRLITV